jgi:peptidoglycan-associated lipoprotein
MKTSKFFNNRLSLVSVALLAMVALAGCSAKSKSKTVGADGAAAGSADATYTDSQKGGVGFGLLDRVHFDFDKSEINSQATETLKKNAATIKASNTMRVLVEGHCDERGTNEYNVALGERRARATLNYLVSLGVARNRLEMKSWGEEKPLIVGHDEKAYAENRRAEFVILQK